MRELKASVLMLGYMTILTGAAYPLVVTMIGTVVFPSQSEGSLIRVDGKVVGSSLIGQSFTRPEYFWGRPSATSPSAYNAAASSGSNLGPRNPALAENVRGRVAELRGSDTASKVPADLATSSASGLDPHISPAGAKFQARRVAAARGVDLNSVNTLVDRYIEGRQFGLLGEPRVNVLLLNLALDGKSTSISVPRGAEESPKP